MVQDLYRCDRQVLDPKRLIPDLMDFQLWNSRIFVFESIVKLPFYLIDHMTIAIDRHRSFLQKIIAPHIIQTSYVISVLMGKKYGIQSSQSCSQHLVPEIRPRINDNVEVTNFQ